MELNIISSEVIKPSSPTPHQFRIHKLSALDQVSGDALFPIILFYPHTWNDTIKTSDHLKNSLSKTLARYYPFAGRVQDEFSIHCDDYGALYIEARVAGKMPEIFKQPNIDLPEQLMPCKMHEKPSVPLNLAAQVTYFDCGGMALCVCFSHVIADITTAANFITTWVKFACDSNISNDDIRDAVSDCSSIFPPQNFSNFSRNTLADKHALSKQNATKRFAFDGMKIAALKEKIAKESASGYYPTRVEVVSALILGGLMAAEKGGDECSHTDLVVSIAVNLRNRLNPPLPEQSIGNIIHGAITKLPIVKKVDHGKLAEKLHESISKINDEYVKKFHASGQFLNNLSISLQGLLDSDKFRWFTISSWCRRPFYETDFGWGKPMWVSTATKHKDVAILIDSLDGKVIEALVVLPKEDMAKFEQDPVIIAFASVNPSLF